MKRYFLLSLLAWSIMTGAQAQDTGISTQLLERLRSKYQPTASDKALDNAVAINGLKALGTTANNNAYDTYFSHKVKSKGITDQKRSGRCWLFTGLNVMRAKAIAKFGMGDFSFSQKRGKFTLKIVFYVFYTPFSGFLRLLPQNSNLSPS